MESLAAGLVLLGGLALSSLAAAAPGAAARPEPPSEHAVKAAFLYHFASFVEWPAEGADGQGAFVVAVLGQDPFGRVLDDTFAGKTVQGRPVEVRRLSRLEDGRPVHLLVISGSEERELAGHLRRLEGVSVLTVADTPGFARRGVMVNFVVVDQRVRFEVNLARAQEAGLRLSSQLLKLATLVGGRRP